MTALLRGYQKRLTSVVVPGLAFAILAGVPAFQTALATTEYLLTYGYFLFFWITQASAWNMLTGYMGYFSFGQAAFFGTGVYVSAILLTHFQWPLLAALPMGGVAAGMLALLIALVIFRLRSMRRDIFSLFTLAIALGMHSFANNARFLDDGRGITLNTAPFPKFFGSTSQMLYIMGLILAFSTVVLTRWIYRSRFGYGLFAIRDDEMVAEALGVPTFWYKTWALVISSFIAGCSGALHAVQLQYITADSVFTLHLPLYVIVASIIGGLGHWGGPVLGAILLHTFTDRLSGAGWEDINQLILGILALSITVYFPRGLYHRFAERAPICVITSMACLLVVPIAVPHRSPLHYLSVAILLGMLPLVLPTHTWNKVQSLFERILTRRHEA